MSFKKNKYQIIRKAISKELADLCYRYLAINYNADAYLINNNVTHEGSVFVGNFKDPQVPNSYAKYGDRLMESLLMQTIPVMEKKTGLKLVPTYSYCRLYKKGNILKRHKDRPSCEYSTTLFLGYDVSNVDDKNYNWPIFIKSYNGEEKSVLLNPGDMVIYKGHDLEHWRDKYEGLNHAQVFLHYNKKNGKYGNINDGREFLGLPSTN